MQLEILISKFQKKDVKAFEELYEMYHQSISGVVYSVVRDQTITQDLVQEVFVKAWKNAESYSTEKGRFFTWLLNIARNTAIDELRSKSHKNTKKNNKDHNRKPNYLGAQTTPNRLHQQNMEYFTQRQYTR